MALYRKKHGIGPGQPIFIVRGGYEDLSQRLTELGWVQNPECESLIFDLKFVTKRKEISFEGLIDGQLVNHFEKNNCLTTKYGLCRNIRNVIWYENEDADQYFPRCFDLSDLADFEDFLLEFRYSEAETVLLQLIERKEVNKLRVEAALSLVGQKCRSVEEKVKKYLEGFKPQLNQKVWKDLNSKRESGESREERDGLEERARSMLERLKAFDPQSQLNRKNIWIVKPASKSRGRGIRTMRGLDKILQYVLGFEQQWVVQKYIERPLIVRGKKFDIRQWAVLTSLQPLRVWLFQKFYVRFSSEDYDPSDLGNKFAHLTNNQINKHKEGFECTEIEGSMYSAEQFTEEARRMGLGDGLAGLRRDIQRLVVSSFKAVSELVVPNRASFQLFGYDIMVDESLHPWLIEVNSSPSMEHSTKVTASLVREGLADLADLLHHHLHRRTTAPKAFGGWVRVLG